MGEESFRLFRPLVISNDITGEQERKSSLLYCPDAKLGRLPTSMGALKKSTSGCVWLTCGFVAADSWLAQRRVFLVLSISTIVKRNNRMETDFG
ncbi:hypothetical protein HZH66_003231 [Vespula vulgaris]|uniref:Uncharacterized protein n=1 Tax=Vespula vulgaris TaxID=7454 RepID=A0A834NI52_VESVU|nr:hypothetical protein HZH66_003231 [Vespula vulgaris]